jgi:hypothetical protein
VVSGFRGGGKLAIADKEEQATARKNEEKFG